MEEKEDELVRFTSDARYSRIPCEFPDKSLYKRYYEAEKIEITLHKGDYLYIPSDWYHFVFSEDTSGPHNVNLAINFWYLKTRENSENVQPYTGKHEISVNLDEYMDDIVQVTESDCSFFLPNYIHSKRFFENIDIKMYDSTMSKFLRKRKPFTYIQQNTMKHPVTPPDNEIQGELGLVNFWVNFGNVNSQLHCDGYDNILCQVEGSKRIILFNPSQRDNLYLYNHYSRALTDKIGYLAAANTVDEKLVLCESNITESNMVLKYTKQLAESGYLKGMKIMNDNMQILKYYNHTPFTNKNKSHFSLFEIQDGECEIEFRNRKKYELTKNSVIMFPDKYFYQYRIKVKSDVVVIKYVPINYYDTAVFNHSFTSVFVKNNAKMEDMPMIIAEANNKLFNFNIFGNVFKYDMVIDSQSKLWCVYIKKGGSIVVNNTVYSEPDTMLVFPMYLQLSHNGEVMCVLVQGPPFK